VAKGRALFKAGKMTESIQVFEAALPASQRMESKIRYLNLTDLIQEALQFSGRGVEAVAMADRALDILKQNPSIPAFRNSMVLGDKGELLTDDWGLSMDRYCEAVPILEQAAAGDRAKFLEDRKAIGHFVTLVSTLQRLSMAYENCGSPKAIDATNQAAEVYVETGRKPDVNAKYHVALAWFLMRDLEKAKAQLKLVDVNWDYGDDLRGRIAVAEGRLADAHKHLAAARQIRIAEIQSSGFQQRNAEARQISNLLLAIETGDRTPGLLAQARDLMKAFPESGGFTSIERLRSRLRALEQK